MPYIPEETVAELRRIDLLTYLQITEPHELVRVTEREYTTQTYDSLRISNGKWHWFSQGVGGNSALDYLIKVKGKTFIEAAQELLNYTTNGFEIPEMKQQLPEKKKILKLPPRDDNNRQLVQYLRQRGIAQAVIDYCINNQSIYQTKTVRNGRTFYNGVFVGRDLSGKPVSAFQRGLSKTSSFRGDVSGSDKRYPFLMGDPNHTTKLRIFESCIDAMSFATRQLMRGKDITNDAVYFSVNGVHYAENAEKTRPPLALKQYLLNHKDTNTIFVHFDNDEVGRKALKNVIRQYLDTHIVVDMTPPEMKDENEYLQHLIYQKSHREVDSVR